MNIQGSKYTKAFVAACSLFVLLGAGGMERAYSAGAPVPSITLQPGSSADKITRAKEWVKSAGSDAQAYGEAIINSVQPPCVLLVLEDIPTLSLWSLKQEGKIPAGIEIYDFDGTFFKPLPSLSNLTGEKTLEVLFKSRESGERDLIEKSPLPVYSTARRDSRDLTDIRQVPWGLSYRFIRDDNVTPDYKDTLNRMQSSQMEKGNPATISPEQQNMRAIYHFMRALNWMGLPGTESHDSARFELKNSLAYAGEMKGIYAMLSEYFLQLGDGDDALKSAQISVARKPEYPKSHFVLGDAYSFKNEYTKAAEAYENGLKLGTFYPDAAFKLAGVYLNLKKYDKSIGLYQMILSQSGQEWTFVRKNLAEAYEAKKDTKKAIEAYKSYLKSVKSPTEKKEIKAKIKLLEKK
jgi:tetratricopeptide (TPR) repeat protein